MIKVAEKAQLKYGNIELVYNFNPLPRRSASNYYRVEVPFRGFKDLGLTNCLIENSTWENRLGGKESIANLMASDIVLWYGIGGEGLVKGIDKIRGEYFDEVKDHAPGYVPPALICDSDDNTDWVHPLNPVYVTLGTRDIVGNLIEPGGSVSISFPDGEIVNLWVDGQTQHDGHTFNVLRNRRFVESCHEFMQKMDGVTTTNKFLADYYENEHNIKNVYVYPNAVIPEDYPQMECKPHKGVRLLWQGGASHAVDLHPLKDAIQHVMEKYPQVTLVMWGMEYKWITRGIPPERVEMVPWVDYHAYIPRRILMDADINLCPLTDNIFARSKSAIKWYESAMMGRPEATIAADVGPYKEIEDGVTGMLYDPRNMGQFVDKIGQLIENEELRRQMGENAKKWVLENRDYKKLAPGLFDYYKEVRRRQLAMFGI